MDNDNFERRNAALWDNESLLSLSPSFVPDPTAAGEAKLIDFGPEDEVAATNSRVPARSVRFETGGIEDQRGGFRNVNDKSSQLGSSTRSARSAHPALPADTSAPTFARHLHSQRKDDDRTERAQQHHSWEENRGQGRRRGRGRNGVRGAGISEERSRPKTIWAGAPKLVTTQQAKDDSKRALAEQRRKKYLATPEDEEEFVGTGYYLWESKDDTPMNLLGMDLEELNVIRIEHKVYIVWDDFLRCLKLSSKSAHRSEAHILAGVRGIRQAIQHAEARAIASSPIYIITPPTASGMRTIVRPRIIEGGQAKNIELAGERLHAGEKAAWAEHRSVLKQANYMMLNELLIKSLLQLAPYKGWMRLRVHFGHIVFTKYRQEFADSKSSFETFSKMMALSRTTAHLERRLEDATVVVKLQERMNDWPTRFCPTKGPADEADDIQSTDRKDTEVIFITTIAGKKLRIEADIDRNCEGGVVEYQVGCTKLYHDNTRNKRVEITTIDIEKQVDWNFEVVTDNSIPESEWPSQVITLTKKSISGRTPTRHDPLGLPFAGVSPKAPFGIQITSVVVRSVTQYKIQDSGYVVEIAVYRTWEGDDLSGDPTMAASTSLFHPLWDLEMDTVEHSTKERGWDKSLSHFLNQGSTPKSCGMKALLDEIEVIQGFLSSTRSSKGSKTSSD